MEEQAEHLTVYFGGHLFAIHGALTSAAEGRQLDPSEVWGVTAAQDRVRGHVGRLRREQDVSYRQSQWQILSDLAEHDWSCIRDHNAEEVKNLVDNHIAFLLRRPFRAYVLPRGVTKEIEKQCHLLVPTSKMLRIALRDELCADVWSLKLHVNHDSTNDVLC
eukprot:4888347-Amphidinium_carterae.1